MMATTHTFIATIIIHFYFFAMIDGRQLRCGLIKPELYDSEYKGCCAGMVYQRRDGDAEFACCEGRNQPYNVKTQICCGKEIVNKTNNLMTCCDNSIRGRNLGGACCGNVYYPKARMNSICCGTLLQEDYLCCRGILKPSGKNQTCCGDKSFNKSTHYCKSKSKGQVIEFGHDVCDGKVFSTSVKICCNRRLLDKESGKVVKCCGTTTHIVNDTDCKEDHVVPKGHMWCPSVNKPYNPKNETCTDHQASQLGCAGQKYDSLNQKCCGGKVVEKSAHCCGHQLYNTQDEICCQDVIIIKKNKTSDDTCCTSQEKPVPYDQDSQRCTEKGVVNKVCGAAVTPRTDLCCGEETLIKNGRNQGMDCCGKNPYFLANQTCDYLSKTVTRRSLPHPCANNVCVNPKRKRSLVQQGFKKFVIIKTKKSGLWKLRMSKRSKKDKNSKLRNKRNKQGPNKRKTARRNNVIRIPCDCKYTARKLILLIKSRPSGEVNEDFYIAEWKKTKSANKKGKKRHIKRSEHP